LIPIENPEEMNLPLTEAVARLKADPEYNEHFRRAFGQDATRTGIAFALASFQRTRLIGDSRADQFEAGNRGALSEREIFGRALFFGKARCASCHNGSNFSDESFHNTGFICTNDLGREEATERSRDRRQFKTPTLRGVLHTAPYLHDGSVATLEQVVETYNKGGIVVENRDTEIKPLGLSESEKAALVEYLRAL
jgi:cytochrome c peroxidase